MWLDGSREVRRVYIKCVRMVVAGDFLCVEAAEGLASTSKFSSPKSNVLSVLIWFSLPVILS